MKKIYLFLLSTLCAFSSFAAIEGVEKLYVVGNATPAGWDQGTAGSTQEMVYQDGKWVWFGNLTANGEFKFLVNDTKWENFISTDCAETATGNTTITIGETCKLYHYPGTAPKDYKFIAPATGEYTITLDLVAETMVVTEGGEVVEPAKPDVTTLFLMGDATTAGTDATKAIEMKGVGEGRFIWTGSLNVGSFFFTNKQEAGYNINPVAGHSTSELTETKGVECGLTFKVTDNTFAVAEAGKYTITVNLNALQMTIDPSILEAEVLNVIGGALETNGNWGDGYPNYPMTAVEGQPGVFTWTGDLYTKDGGAELKFRIGKDWERNFVLASDADKFIAPEYGKTYNLFFRSMNNNTIVGDNKFLVTTAGKYKFTIDLNELTLKVEDGNDIETGIASLDVAHCVVLAADGAISVSSVAAIQQAAVYDIAGKCVNRLAGIEGRTVLADNLADGLYVVKLWMNGEETTQKVMVK